MNELSSGSPERKPDEASLGQPFVSGARLLELLFAEGSRPTLRWLRDQQKARRIPFVKIGGRVFFSPTQVRSAFDQLPTARFKRI